MQILLDRHKMVKPLFFVVCVFVTLACIEAVPWYRPKPTTRNGSVGNSGNGASTDFGVETFDATASDARTMSGGSLTRGNHRYSDEDVVERVTESGYGYQGSRGTYGGLGQAGGRGFQRGRQPQGGFDSTGGRGSYDGWGKPSSGSYPGSYPGNQGRQGYGDDDRIHENRDNGDNSDEYPTTKKSKRRCNGCSYTNIGNGVSNSNKFFLHENN